MTATLSTLSATTPEAEAAPVPDDAPRVADFPDVALAAVVGQSVFAPTRSSLEETKADPAFRSPSFAPAVVVEVGPAVSRLSFDYGAPEAIPNAYILPIPAQAEAAPGDVVLASRYGNALEIAVVTAGTADGATPKADFVAVRPYGTERVKALEQGVWLPVPSTLAPGAIAAVKHADARPSFGIVLARVGGRVLLTGFMGALVVAAESDVVVVEGRPAAHTGDEVFACFSSGDFVKARVESVAPTGRTATIEFLDLPAPRTEVLPLVFLTKRL